MKSLRVSATKYAAIVCLLAWSMGCGSSSSTAPTTTASTFQSLLGDWSGTQAVAGTSNRTTDFLITCNQAMSVTKQTDGTFSGTFSVTGNNAACVYSGTVDSGTLTTTGALTAKLTTLVNAQAGCSRTSGDGVYRGSVSGTRISWTMTETVECTNPTETVTRTWTISTTKR